MFFSKIRKIMYTPVNPVLLYKRGLRVSKLYRRVFVMFSYFSTEKNVVGTHYYYHYY